jgi:hypothetical protein
VLTTHTRATRNGDDTGKYNREDSHYAPDGEAPFQAVAVDE